MITLTESFPLPTMPARAGTWPTAAVPVFRSTAPVRTTAWSRSTRVEWVADKVNATEVAAAELAAAAPSAPRAEPGRAGCDPKAPPNAAAPKATAATRAVATVATATRRLLRRKADRIRTGSDGAGGGCSTAVSAPGASTGARCSGGRTINAVAVSSRCRHRVDRPRSGVAGHEDPVAILQRFTHLCPFVVPVRRRWRPEAGNTAPGPVCSMAIVDKGGAGIIGRARRGGWVRRPGTYAGGRNSIRAPVPVLIT